MKTLIPVSRTIPKELDLDSYEPITINPLKNLMSTVLERKESLIKEAIEFKLGKDFTIDDVKQRAKLVIDNGIENFTIDNELSII